jgi:hypothetical protein
MANEYWLLAYGSGQDMTEEEIYDRPGLNPERITNNWDEYKRPDLDDVLNEIIELTEGKRQKEQLADNIINYSQSPPVGMNTVVTLYYPENEHVKKLRQAFFKSKYIGDNGEEGYKKRFIKKLATENAEALKAHYGASDNDIAYMIEKGSIPDHIDLTVEHITDRNFGGTNDESNLIAMPKKINERKNKLVQAQLRLRKSQDEPCWLISWHPERNKDGSFPNLYIPNRNTFAPESSVDFE